jgi:hypothetical protein
VEEEKREIENSGPTRKINGGLDDHIFVSGVLSLKGVPAIRAASSVIGTASSAVLAIRRAGNCDVIVKKFSAPPSAKQGTRAGK